MSIEPIIVGIIVFGAIAYAGFLIAQKMFSFGRKTSCGSDCGCDSPTQKLAIPAKKK